MNKENGIQKYQGNLSTRREQSVVKHPGVNIIEGEFRYLDDSPTGTQVKTGENKWRTGCLILLAGAGLTGIAVGAYALANPCTWQGKDCGVYLRTPTVSCAAGEPNPKPTEQPINKENLSRYTWRHLNPGECADVRPGDFFMGDGSVDGVFMTDSNEDTGAIYSFERSARVKADFGGDIRTPINFNDKPNLLAEAVDQMLNTGGVNHRGVKIVFVTTFQTDGKNIEVPYGRK